MNELAKRRFKGKDQTRWQLATVVAVLLAGLASNYILDGVFFRWPW
jgi:hypothetical protein